MTDKAHKYTQNVPALTKNQGLVFDTLNEAAKPLTAYAILDVLKDDGVRAPLQVYRALDKLVELKCVHRLESLNAFVACRHPSCQTQQVIAFAICEICGKVTELSDSDLADNILNIANKHKFTIQKSTVEIRCICKDCASA